MAMSTPPWRSIPPVNGFYRASDSGFNSVNAKKSISRPFFTTQKQPPQEPPASSQNMQSKKTHFPDALKAYVARTFEDCPEKDKAAVEVELKKIITDAFEKKVVWTIDWDNFPLPASRDASKNVNQGAKFDLMTASPPKSPIPPTSKFSAVKLNRDGNEYKGTKRKLGNKSWDNASPSPADSPASDRSYRKPKRLNSGENYEGQDAFDRLNKRYERKWSASHNGMPLNKPSTPLPNGGVVVGRCMDLEKRYLRLTAAPHPDTVRPLHVLEKTLEFLKAKWKAENNYSYICDQFKSLRQDLTVQHIKNEFTVNVYEIHARIALEKGDLGEYNQCQSQLYNLYSDKVEGGHPMEFKAYRILYLIHTRNLSELKDLLASLTTVEKENPFIAHALSVRSAAESGNYSRFFRLYLDAPNMGAYLIDSFIARERLSALCVICKAYRPDIPIKLLTDELAFENDDETYTFIESHNARDYLEEKSDGSMKLNTAQALPAFEAARVATRKVDIKGQI